MPSCFDVIGSENDAVYKPPFVKFPFDLKTISA